MSAAKTNIDASEVCVQEVDSAIDPISFCFKCEKFYNSSCEIYHTIVLIADCLENQLFGNWRHHAYLVHFFLSLVFHFPSILLDVEVSLYFRVLLSLPCFQPGQQFVGTPFQAAY